MRLSTVFARACLFLAGGASLFAANIGGLETVYLVPNPFLGVALGAQYNALPDGELYRRETIIRLPVSKRLEASARIPWLNLRDRRLPYWDGFGDIEARFNYASDAFKNWLLVNYTLAWNFGTARELRPQTTHPLEGYGRDELQFGALWQRRFAGWSLMGDWQYHLRAAKNQAVLGGFDLNLASARAWRRWLGLNPTDKNNFLYSGRLANDALCLRTGAGTLLSPPIVVYTLLEYWRGFSPEAPYATDALPGYRSRPLRIIGGAKYFFSRETLHIEIGLNAGINQAARRFSPWGALFGFAGEF